MKQIHDPLIFVQIELVITNFAVTCITNVVIYMYNATAILLEVTLCDSMQTFLSRCTENIIVRATDLHERKCRSYKDLISFLQSLTRSYERVVYK